MTVLHLPDVSEFQPNVDWAKVAGHNGGAAIIRAYNGYRVDHCWYGGARRADAHAKGIRVLGIYAYLVPSRPWLDQAREFIAIVGKLQPGEFVVLDYEDPGFHGDQRAEAHAWLAYIDNHLTYPGYAGAWLYSDVGFADSHGLDEIFRSKRHTWVASYSAYEPQLPHSLWQHADAEAWPGIGRCDCSIFHGDVAQLEAKVWTRADGAPPKPAGVTGDTGNVGHTTRPRRKPAAKPKRKKAKKHVSKPPAQPAPPPTPAPRKKPAQSNVVHLALIAAGSVVSLLVAHGVLSKDDLNMIAPLLLAVGVTYNVPKR
ncbi:MAG TPA: GH25 family lysozyme [Mycobacteriales bacterium]|nr:GH25 family lysozyme [Mycobacteriales bacterium]